MCGRTTLINAPEGAGSSNEAPHLVWVLSSAMVSREGLLAVLLAIASQAPIILACDQAVRDQEFDVKPPLAEASVHGDELSVRLTPETQMSAVVDLAIDPLKPGMTIEEAAKQSVSPWRPAPMARTPGICIAPVE
jgi:hypothetical protein